MCSGVSSTVVKEATFCFQEVWVMLGCLREFESGLMLDDVEDLVDRVVSGVKTVEFSIFPVVGGVSSLKVGA